MRSFRYFGTPFILAFILAGCGTSDFVIRQSKKIYLYDSGIEELTTNLEQSYLKTVASRDREIERKRMAILILVNEDGQKTDLGKEIANSIQVNIFNPQLFMLLERERIDSLLEEFELGFSGMVETMSTRELGKLLGSELVVVGTIREKEYITVQSRIVDLESGEIFGIAEVAIDLYGYFTATPDLKNETGRPLAASGKYASPEKTLETITEALAMRDLEQFFDCIALEEARNIINYHEEEQYQSDYEVMAWIRDEYFEDDDDIQEVYEFFRNLEILKEKDSNMERKIVVAGVTFDDESHMIDLTFRNHSGEWKFDFMLMIIELK